MTRFDTIVMVDWSAAATPKTGADSIWVAISRPGDRVPKLFNPPARAALFPALVSLLAEEIAAGHRVLAGFDFAFAYPQGFAKALGLDGPPWSAIWALLARTIQDGPENQNNRFSVAAALNRRIGAAPGPFWSCPPKAAGPDLTTTRPPWNPAWGVTETRLAEKLGKAHSPWKLYTTGSVGGQSLMGIPFLYRLRHDPALAAHCRVWPFETELTVPEAPLVLTEIFPSLLPIPADRPDLGPAGAVKDARQVAALCDWVRGTDLTPYFTLPELAAAERARVTQEEGWILGVLSERATD